MERENRSGDFTSASSGFNATPQTQDTCKSSFAMCEQLLTNKLSSNQKVSNDLGFGGISATNKTAVGSLTGRFSQAVADPSMFSLF